MRRMAQRHESWKKAFRGLVERPIPGSQTVLLLQVQFFLSYFISATCRETRETPIDHFERDFTELLEVAEAFLTRRERLSQQMFGPERSGKSTAESQARNLGL